MPIRRKIEVQISKKKKMKSLTAKPSPTLRHFTPQVFFVLSMLMQINKYTFYKSEDVVYIVYNLFT